MKILKSLFQVISSKKITQTLLNILMLSLIVLLLDITKEEPFKWLEASFRQLQNQICQFDAINLPNRKEKAIFIESIKNTISPSSSTNPKK